MGVYAVRVSILDDSKKYDGMLNIGTRPTFMVETYRLK